MIRIEALKKSYGKNLVLKDINISFNKGEVAGIIGENGAGKTTLFRSISGLEKYEGKIYSDEQTILKNKLGILQTEPYFFKRITGREYIQLHCNSRNENITDIDTLNIFDLPLDRYATSYSTGMKKKLALTAILLQNNDYYILDEPYHGVDIQSSMLITEIILRLKKMGKCVIISSHIFSTLKDCCNVIHILKEGTIRRSIGHDDFEKLEEEYKELTIGNKLEHFFSKY